MSPTAVLARPGVLTHPRLPGVTVCFEELTPDLARHYLKKLPPRQRLLSERTVDRYSTDMAGDDWLFTGDAIRFNVDDELVDGQHRCEGVVQSGETQLTLVIRGLSNDAIIAFDTGRGRTFSDILRIREIPNHSAVAALTSRVLQWRRGNYATPGVPRVIVPQYLNVPASTGALLECFDSLSHPIQLSAKHGAAMSAHFPKKTAPSSVLGFCHLLFGALDAEYCAQFFYEVINGPAKNGPEQPIFVLRKALGKAPAPGESAKPDWVWLAYIISTWNLYLDGGELKQLRRPLPKWDTVPKPVDPHADAREEGWTPL